MAKAKQVNSTSSDAPLSKDTALRLYEFILRTYLFEENLHLLYRKGELMGGLYTGSGNEAVCVGTTLPTEAGDVIAPSHRGMGAHFVRGETFRGMMLQLMAKKEGGTKGKDNAAHQGSMQLGILGMISHLAVMPATALGCALAHKIRRNKKVAIGFIGEGSTSLGDFHETLNMAAVLKLPFIMVIENNQWAYSTPVSKQYACKQLSDRGVGYGIPAFTIDGTDAELVYTTANKAIERARRGEGPTLIEAVTMRLRGHSAADMAEYVPKGLLDSWKEKLPHLLYKQKLIARGWLTEAAHEQLETKIHAEIDAAVTYAKQAADPEPYITLEGVYAE